MLRGVIVIPTESTLLINFRRGLVNTSPLATENICLSSRDQRPFTNRTLRKRIVDIDIDRHIQRSASYRVFWQGTASDSTRFVRFDTRSPLREMANSVEWIHCYNAGRVRNENAG